MFNCYLHGWSHIEQPCPLCHPVHIYTSSSTEITIPVKNYNSELEELKIMNQKLLTALLRIQVRVDETNYHSTDKNAISKIIKDCLNENN